MLKVDEYEKIRRAYYIEQKSIRQIARERGHSRKSVQKALGNSEPKPYQRQEERTAPTLGGYKARIAALLEENQQLPRKYSYTGHKIYEVIAREGYVGSESGVRRYIGAWRRLHNSPAVYLPLEFEPGADAQADWGEGEVVMAGERISVQLFTIRLCYSRRLFMMAFPSQKLEAFLEGHVAAFGYFEGVPQRISYDNLKTAVKDILGGQARQEQAGFLAFRSHYLFESHFCTPGQGHEKGGVEHGVGYGRRNFLVRLPATSAAMGRLRTSSTRCIICPCWRAAPEPLTTPNHCAPGAPSGRQSMSKPWLSCAACGPTDGACANLSRYCAYTRTIPHAL